MLANGSAIHGSLAPSATAMTGKKTGAGTTDTLCTIRIIGQARDRTQRNSPRALFRTDVLSLLRHGSLHERYEKDECQSEHAEQPEDIEVGQ